MDGSSSEELPSSIFTTGWGSVESEWRKSRKVLPWMHGAQALPTGRRRRHEDIAMRVLIDGDRRYIGAVLVPFVQAAGHEVVGLDIGWYDGCDFGVQPGGYEQRTQDIRDVSPDDL